LEITKEDVMADTTPRQPRYVELLPPEPSAASRPVTQTESRPPAVRDNWLPAPLIQRVLDKIATKNAEAYAGRIAAENHVITLWTERLRLQEEFEAGLARFEALPLLRQAATAKVYAEVEQIFEDIDDQKDERRLQRIRRNADIIRAERELEELKRGPLPALPAAQPVKESRSKRRVRRIKEVNDECEQTIAALRKGRKDEDLDPDTLEMISECRYHAKRRINEIMQED
jgi:hypothetical protein